MNIAGCVVAVLVLLTGVLPARAAEQVKLEVGDKAPPFSLAGTDGKTHALKDHVGTRPVVIAWFPKAFTSG